MTTDELIKELPKGVFKWYDFSKEGKFLYIVNTKDVSVDNEDSIESLLSICGIQGKVLSVDDILNNEVANESYDYIIGIGIIESCSQIQKLMSFLYNALKENGRLLLGADNRLAIRYFCGDRDRFTGSVFDSIENYAHLGDKVVENFGGRAYSKVELEQMLDKAGFMNRVFYSVYPALERPQIMCSETYLPQEDLATRIVPQYNSPETVFLDEDRLYDTLINNGLFHIMANGFLIECCKASELTNAKQITISMDRGPENAMATILHKNDTVEKKALYDEGKNKIFQLKENHDYLKQQGIPVVETKIVNHSAVMPYIDGIIGTRYYENLIKSDKEKFCKKIDELWELILKSSEHVPYEEVDWDRFDPRWERRKADDPNRDKWRKVAFGTEEDRADLGVILKRGYIDLVSLNCFIVDDMPVFFDQELYVENLPAKVIMIRTIDFAVWSLIGVESTAVRDELYARYGLTKYQDLFHDYINVFMDKFRNDSKLSVYHSRYRKDYTVINCNRQRMNFSADEYQRLFYGLFRNAEGKKLYIFGSGNYAKHFISQYASDHEIAGILDNNPSKWGAELEGIPIYSPQYLMTLAPETYKVIICIKYYMPVVKQLKIMGVNSYGIYDSDLCLPDQRQLVIADKNTTEKPKKYHIGYISGVFDLFHVGHLNMFKRAKEQCDYLIVGVVSDESVMNSKKTMPFVPFEERIEMVRSCRYVDEAVAIPKDYGNADEAYKRYQFDVQFSGSDYENDPWWLSMREYLRKHGSDLVFFPYTQSTSSSKLKELIYKKLV